MGTAKKSDKPVIEYNHVYLDSYQVLIRHSKTCPMSTSAPKVELRRQTLDSRHHYEEKLSLLSSSEEELESDRVGVGVRFFNCDSH
jgi:hypothetical protein